MTSNADLPRLDLDELRDGGYLQEANRLFFHPLGLALALVHPWVCEECGQPWPEIGEQCVRCGNRTRIYGTARLEVLDDRGDPEGWCFEGIDLLPHALKIEAESDARMSARRAALGYYTQPAGDGR